MPTDTAYVDANFKEVQLAQVRAGQPVTLTSDLYGDGVKFHGRVRGLSGGTGSAFSLIPAQNASGNWIKIVQRLPVRIALDPAELAAAPAARRPVDEGHDRRLETPVRPPSISPPTRGSAMAEARAARVPAAPARDDRRALAITSIALALGTFMQVLDGTIANVSIPTIAGNLGVSADQGTWVITSFAVANGVSVPLTGWLMGRYGVVKTFVASVAAVHHRLVPLRHLLEPAVADRLPRPAGRGVRADDPGLAGAADLDLPGQPARHGAGDLVDDHPGGADLRADPRRLYLRQHLLAVDLPDQRAGGHRLRLALLAQHDEPRDADPQGRRSTRTGFMLLLVWVGALQVMLDTGKDADWFASPAIVVLSAGRRRSASSPG